MESLVARGADSWSEQQTGEYESLEARYRDLTRRIEAEERFSKIAEPTGSPVTITTSADTASDSEYAATFNAYLARGIDGLSSEERNILTRSESRTMSTTTDSQGGYLVPETVANTIAETLKSFGGIRKLATVITSSSGADLHYPKADDAGLGEIVAENQEVSDADLSFQVATLRAWIYSSKAVRVPVSLLEDSFPDLGSFIGRRLAERIARLQAFHYVIGDGVDEPEGIITGRDKTKDVLTSAAVSYDNLVTLVHRVDPAYRPGASFVANDSIVGAFSRLVDGDLRPLWLPSMREAVPGQLFGFPLVIDQNMPNDDTAATPNTDECPVLFGNLKEAYVIRDVKGVEILRLNETRARWRQVEFIGFHRSDARVVNQAAYACIRRNS